MKKISQGKFELCTTKAEAIERFMQMQGGIRENMLDGSRIMFYCSKKGRITITNPPTRRHIEHSNSTELFAEIIGQNGKTYVSYYTAFSRANSVLKMVAYAINILFAVLAIITAIMNEEKMISFIILAFCLALFFYFLFSATKEKANAPKDSEILINALEERVNAVNQWDK